MGLDDIFDILILVIVIALLSPLMLKSTVPLFNGEVGGFETVINKNAEQSDKQIVFKEDILTKEDLLLMLAVADEKTPAPSVLQLAIDKNNDGMVSNNYGEHEISDVINLNDLSTQDTSKITNFINFINSIPNNMSLKIAPYIDKGGIQKWVVYKN